MSYKYPNTKSESSSPIENKQERIITEFLSEYFYGKAYANHEVVEDRAAQQKGVDVIVYAPNGTEYHDIIAQASKLSINHPRPNFSMALLSDINGEETVGWFLRNDMLTHVYVLCWVNSAATNSYGYLSNPEDIDELEVMFIDKQELKEFVNGYIYDDSMYYTAQKMRNKGDTRLFLNEAMYMVYSDGLNDRPVSLVLKKFALEKVAYQRFLVSKQSIKALM